MNLVYYIIRKEYPTYIHDEDMVQCGMVGLCQAADKWDESKGTFSTFAAYAIRNEIIREFKKRAKHFGVLSLDYEMVHDGSRRSLGDTIVGDEDVGYVDLEVKSCRINPTEQKIYELLLTGLPPRAVAKQLGVSYSFVYATRRKLKLLRQRGNRKER